MSETNLRLCLPSRKLGKISYVVVFTFVGFEVGSQIHANVFDVNQKAVGPNQPYQRNKSRISNLDDKAMGNKGSQWISPGQKPLR